MQLIFHRILENFLHPKSGANTKDFCRQYQVKLDPKLAPNLQKYAKLATLYINLQNLPNLHTLITKLS